MSLRSTLALHLGDFRENPKDRESRLEAELGRPEEFSKGAIRRDADGQLWRVVQTRRRTYWERTLTLTPAKRDRMYQLIGYGRWIAFGYLLAWLIFWMLRLDALNVGGMVPTYVLAEGLNSIAPVFLLIFFLRFLPKTAAVIEEDGRTSSA